MTSRRCVVLLVDGARADVFDELVRDGQLPNITRHVVEPGGRTVLTTTFTSTSGPAYLPFLSGSFAGTANVPGIRWNQRDQLARPGGRFRRAAQRSYCGPGVWRLDDDVSRDVPWLFDIARAPYNVFGPFTRGLAAEANARPYLKSWLWWRCHMTGEFERADNAAIQLLLAAVVQRDFDLCFCVLPGVDGLSHHLHPHHERVIEAYRRADAAVGRLVDALTRAGRRDETTLVVCSDHGLTRTTTHFDLPVELERQLRIPTMAYLNTLRPLRPQATVQVSGNAFAHVYLRGSGWGTPASVETIERRHADLIPWLLASESVDVLLVRDDDMRSIRVLSRRGQAVLREDEDGICYEPANGSDPFGYGPLPPRMGLQEALELTFDSEYPDALVQAAQLFRSPRCGDLVVTARPGHDLRERWERPEHLSSHGSLHRDHMLTPFAASRPLPTGPARTADAFPLFVDAIGGTIPPARRLDATDSLARVAYFREVP